MKKVLILLFVLLSFFCLVSCKDKIEPKTVFTHEDYLKSSGYPTTCEIPVGIKTIEANTFKDATELESVFIPSTVITINSNAFFNCSGLKELVIPSSVKEIFTDALLGVNPSIINNNSAVVLSFVYNKQ